MYRTGSKNSLVGPAVMRQRTDMRAGFHPRGGKAQHESAGFSSLPPWGMSQGKSVCCRPAATGDSPSVGRMWISFAYCPRSAGCELFLLKILNWV